MLSFSLDGHGKLFEELLELTFDLELLFVNPVMTPAGLRSSRD
jgi:hypothetical protein